MTHSPTEREDMFGSLAVETKAFGDQSLGSVTRIFDPHIYIDNRFDV